MPYGCVYTVKWGGVRWCKHRADFQDQVILCAGGVWELLLAEGRFDCNIK